MQGTEKAEVLTKQRLALLAGVCALGVPELIAGQVVTLPDKVSCARCAIIMGPVATLAPPPDAVVDRPGRIRADRSGRYWMFLEQDLPAIYDANGKFMRSLGRKGQGPGEYQMASNVIFAGDSTVVFDDFPRRATVLDAALVPRVSGIWLRNQVAHVHRACERTCLGGVVQRVSAVRMDDRKHARARTRTTPIVVSG